MTDRQPLALDDIDAARRHIEQHIDEMVLEQVHLVDIEEAAVRGGQQPRREGLDAIHQGALEVDGADDAVLGGAERQVDHGDRAALRPADTATRASRAGGGGCGRVAVVGAAGDSVHGRQQVGERSYGRALGGAAVAGDQYAADRRVDDREQDGEFEVFLADDGRERERGGGRHGGSVCHPRGKSCATGGLRCGILAAYHVST